MQEVKTPLVQLKIRAEQQQKDKLVKTGEGTPAGETVQITVEGSANFIMTPKILFVDEETTQNPLKYIETLNLALPKIPTKALYKLQVCVAHEI
jgi:hypothetical protein